MINPQECTLFSGGVQGAEAQFGQQAEAFNVEEVNFTFEGHQLERQRGIRHLTHEELLKGDVSLAYVSKLMNRKYSSGPKFRKVLQSIWHMVNNSQEIYVVGMIQEDNTVKGGTGWGAEFAKICNKPLFVFDQEKSKWFQWSGESWDEATPVIQHSHFAGTGTRFLNDAGKEAIKDLFQRSFK